MLFFGGLAGGENRTRPAAGVNGTAMNALLVYPEFPNTFWSYKHALKFIRKKAAFPPLGLLTLAALLPPQWSLRLVDQNVRKLTAKDLAWADLAFISAMAVQRTSTLRLIAELKAAGITVVAGGPLFTSEPDAFDAVDHLVLNEAEMTLPVFLSDLRRVNPRRVYRSSVFCDLTQTPAPRWDLLDLSKYASMCVQFSRGCPFNCDFCNVTSLFGRRVRIKTAMQMVAELDALYALGWHRPLFFVDDNFIGNKTYLKTQLLPAITEWRRDKQNITFNTEASINLADDQELMEMMVAAGFDSVFIGIETPDEQSLAECGKRQNRNRDLMASVKSIHRAGIQVQAGFIVGFDHDSPGIFQRHIDFIQNSGVVTAMVGLLQAPLGTRLYNRLMQEGRIAGGLSGDNADGTTNIIPKMDVAQLKRGYQYILQSIYRPRNYYRRVRTFLKEYNRPQATISLDLQRVLAVFRSSVRLGIFGRERFQYWWLLLWTLMRFPHHFPLAVTLAIYGYHYRRVARSTWR
jgi:radical SAM superfamily enzyme YgiQ (UPF0313 family)